MTPRTDRLAVFEKLASDMAQRSDATNAAFTPSNLRMESRASGNRSASEAAGASGSRTENSVVSLTKEAACGRQKTAVAYQFPSAVVGCSTTALGNWYATAVFW